MFEIDFLPVGNSNGDAICVQYSVPGGVLVHVVDGAYKDVGDVVRAAEGAGLARRVVRLEPIVCIKG